MTWACVGWRTAAGPCHCNVLCLSFSLTTAEVMVLPMSSGFSRSAASYGHVPNVHAVENFQVRVIPARLVAAIFCFSRVHFASLRLSIRRRAWASMGATGACRRSSWQLWALACDALSHARLWGD